MDRKKFFRGVRDFRKFSHSCVSDLNVDDELICFVYTPKSESGQPSGAPLNISIDMEDSPDVTRVFIGEKESKYKMKLLPEIVNDLLASLSSFSLSLSRHYSMSLTPC